MALWAGLRVAATLGAALAWLVALFVPWRTEGPVSTTSLADATRMVLQGRVDAVVPQGAGLLLVLPSLCAVVLIATAMPTQRAVVIVRRCAAATGSLVSLALIVVIVGWPPWPMAAGGWLSVGGAVLATAGCLAPLGAGRPRSNPSPASTASLS